MKIVIEITEDCTKTNYNQIKAIMDNYLESEFSKMTRDESYVKEHSSFDKRPFTISFDAP